ncbi:MAG: stage III sporulation protein AE [Lachnospiraceae bacterium]|nr:stage III sporulation protein AE [Lachnospiraceae bacterium]MDY5497507.1 stage III sporulation protein AE [Anaerobutyricum sp.]
MKQIIIIFLSFFCFLLFFTPVRAEENKNEIEKIDVEGVSREIKDLQKEYTYPDFEEIFQCLINLNFKKAFMKLISWLYEIAFFELKSSKLLIGELIGVIIFSALFSNIASSFQNFGVADSGFFISYFITFTIIFTNFNIMGNLFKNTIKLLSSFLKILLPVFTLSISFSGNLSTGVIFYEYFMIVVLIINWLCINILLPVIQYYLLLELLNNFSGKQNISRLCDSLYFLLSRGIHVMFFILFGFHILETMIAPSVDATKNIVLDRLLGMIPGAGSIAQSVTGTVIGSSLLIKNTLGVTVIIFIFVLLAAPLLKLILYSLFYLFLSIVLEPVADERFIKCISAAGKSGMLLIKILCMSSVLFILIIAVTSLATNHVG